MNKLTETISPTEAGGDSNKKRKGTLFQKMLDDKKAVSRYIQGKDTLEQVDARGIKFVKPI